MHATSMKAVLALLIQLPANTALPVLVLHLLKMPSLVVL